MAVTPLPTADPVIYPDSDGQPMADNTEQFRWIVLIKENLEALFADREDVFVAGDLLWYPTEGDNRTRLAPDVMVAFGRLKGYRGSYRQWEEGGIAPQVVFEILSPGNRYGEMSRKLDFYERYGVEEYYVYDPEGFDLIGYERQNGRLRLQSLMNGLVSPRLGIRFELPESREMRLYRPDGTPFESFTQIIARRDAAVAAQHVAETQRDAAEARAARLAERLRQMGIDPEAEE